MPGKLVIVESPAKAKTIEKYLGRDYRVCASLGHVRDLPKSKLGVDIDQDFEPHYLVPKEKLSRVKEIRQQAQRADEIILATDPDREGEAIAWHLAQTIDPGDRPVRRVEFHEITRAAVLEALRQPRAIDVLRVDAQQARRILDRLVGYQISPLLWKKVQRGLSAGRVQSAALRLIVEREREVTSFVPTEYWSIEAELAKRVPSAVATLTFSATLAEIDGAKVEIGDQPRADGIITDLNGARYAVESVRERQQQRQPPPPYTTSTLQQEASRKLGLSASRTMAVAQQLYEGLSLGEEEGVGLITYMRTDSTQVASSAVDELRQFIQERHGREMLSATPRVYRTRSRLAQEAHEAIRPTSAYRTPEQVSRFLARDQARLYDLIWKRFVATQMAPARLQITSADVRAERAGSPHRYRFHAAGSVLTFAGFLSLYVEAKDEDAALADEDRKPLPPLVVGEELDLVKLVPEQHFTQPPPRYTEATLVRTLEERGIGRPSTYAPTIQTVKDRGYVEAVERRLEPTQLGTLVNDLLVEHFPAVLDIDFTANMEEQLDDIAQGRRERVQVLREFYGPFSGALVAAEQQMEHVQPPAEVTDEVCEKCGRPMVIKHGRYGKFIACSGFPECRNTKPFLNKVGALCPECEAPIVERHTRNRRRFYACSRSPECRWTSWARPLSQPCPSCGGLLVESGRDRARCARCGVTRPMRELEEASAANVSDGDGRS